MTRIAAAIAALLLLPLLGACGSDGTEPKAVPTPPSAPEMTDVPGFGDETTTQASTVALPLPKGCDVISSSTVRKVLGISVAGKSDDTNGNAQCSYQPNPAVRFLIVTAFDLDVSTGAPAEVLDRVFGIGGTKETLPGVGDLAKIVIQGTTANAIALEQAGTHYRIVMLTSSDASGHVPQWRPVMTALEREAMVSMLK